MTKTLTGDDILVYVKMS